MLSATAGVTRCWLGTWESEFWCTNFGASGMAGGSASRCPPSRLTIPGNGDSFELNIRGSFGSGRGRKPVEVVGVDS